MKKRFVLVKTLQLLLIMLITIAGLVIIFTDSALYQMIGRNDSVCALCVLLWIVLVFSYLGIFWDFSTHSSFKKSYRELDYIVHNDPVSGIANRYACDSMIEKYIDKPLPDTIGCVMLDLMNIREINDKYGHARGNATILDFANILYTCSLGVCFVGRNGGNKFMALFEDCTREQISAFLARVEQQVDMHNANPDEPTIVYRTGRAYSADEHVTTISQLIALSDRRLHPEKDYVAGIANRASCDDIIAQYLDKPLPERIGCIMLNISNIVTINNTAGRLAGNRAIRQFGDILKNASNGLCFVGRNGGTKFLALFEDCSESKLTDFIKRTEEGVAAYNKLDDAAPIEFCFGKAFHEGPDITAIHQLIALSDRRMLGTDK